MERESFEDAAMARQLNERFVAIKVDREERPDVDDIYMSALQAHDRQRRLADDRVPDAGAGSRSSPAPTSRRRSRPGAPAFPTVLPPLREAWAQRAQRRRAQAEELLEHAAHRGGPARRARASPPSAPARRRAGFSALRPARTAASAARRSFRSQPLLHYLLRWHAAATTSARTMLVTHARAHDGRRHVRPVGGGFARYSTDERWHVPHFEKMLYDNAQLARVYAEAFR